MIFRIVLLSFCLLMNSCSTSNPRVAAEEMGHQTKINKVKKNSPEIISLRYDTEEFIADKKRSGESPLFLKNQKIFNEVVFRDIQSDPKKIADRKLRLLDFISADDQNAQSVRQSFQSLEDVVTDHIVRFKKTFPHADYNYDIYIVPSMLWFSGRATILNKNDVIVAFGADNIAKNKENISILIAHEMFHALHYKSLRLTKIDLDSMESDPIALMWFEGFASYESAIVNQLVPGAVEIFGKQGREFEKRRLVLAKHFVRDIVNHPVFDASLTNKWFGSGDMTQGIPAMTGYYFGLLVVKDLLKSNRPEDLLNWNPMEKKIQIFNGLLEYAP